MPTRMIRDGILSSERIARLSWPEEVFYRRLMSVVDDYGRFHAHHSLLRAACYPLQLEKVSDSDIGKWLLATEKAGLVRVYPAADGKRYLEILDFGQRVQSKSKFPEPVAQTPRNLTGDDWGQQDSTVIHGGPPESTAVVGVGVEDEVEGVPRKRARSRKTPLPDDFELSKRVKQWAQEKGYRQLDAHFEAFVSKAKANDYSYADWDEALMGAIRQDWAKLNSSASSPSGESRQRVDL